MLIFILVGGAHYYRQQGHFPHQNSLNNAVAHGLDNIHSSDRRASSVQSFQKMFSSQTPSISKSYPRLQNYFSPQTSSPTSPFSSHTTLSYTTCKNLSLYPNVHRLDHYHSRQISVSKTRTNDEKLPVINSHTSDERIIPTDLTKELTTVTLENTEYENVFKKSEPVEIRVRCIFSRVGEIDTLNERYTAEIVFEASWYDYDKKIESKYDPQMGHFNPQLVVVNHMGDSLRHEVNNSPPRPDVNFIFCLFRNGIQLQKRMKII